MKCLSNLWREHMIKSIQLKNWKSHKDSNLEFQSGTNVLVGSMGAGKSSILQAISFALFGTFAELKHRDLKTADIITRGAEQKVAEISLTLTSPQNKLFQIKRKIDAKKNVSEGAIRDSEGKLLAGPQTTQLNEFVKKELGVDDEIFLRTVYAMQNDIDMILKLAPKERKKRIDELMGLDKFEKARNNCVTLRNKTLRQKQDYDAFLESVGLDNLSKKVDEINKQVNTLKSKQLTLQSDLSSKRLQKDSSRIFLLELREKLGEFSKLVEKKKALLKQIWNLDEKLQGKTVSRTKEELEKELVELRVKVTELQKEKTMLSEKTNQSQLEFMSADKNLALADSKIRDINSKLDNITKLKENLSGQKVVDLNTELAELKKDLDARKDGRQSNLAQLKELRNHLEQLTLAESKCPVCNAKLSETSKSDLVSKRKKDISQILFQNTELAEKTELLERRYEELQEIADKNRHALEELSKENELKSEYSKLTVEITTSQKIVLESQTLLEHAKKRTQVLESDITKLNTQISELNDTRFLHELKEQHFRATSELELVDQDLKKQDVSKEKVDEQEDKFQQLLRQVQELETNLSNFKTLMLEKAKQLAELKSQQQKAMDLQSKIAVLEEKTSFLDRFRTALEATQLALRDELILAVNEVMSQVWIEIYPYDKWAAVRLSSTEQDYTLQLKETGGEWVSVTGFASGGERMLASLAVRIAFARVLAPALSLLILDEPTHNLDEKAISTFIDVLQNKVSDFIDQIFIVTHEEKLAEQADHVIRL